MNLNQQELAKRLGVSQMTVSRALNGRPGIGEPLRKRILRAARQHGYVHDRLASGLKGKGTPVIGLVMPSIDNSFFPEITRTAEARVKQAGYRLLLAHSGESYEQECTEINLLRGFHVQGLIIAPSGNPNDIDVYKTLAQQGIPFVFIDRIKRGVHCSYVITDTELGAYQLGRYLRERGYRKWGYLRGPRGISTSEDHVRGLRKSLSEGEGIKMTTVAAGFELEDGHRAAKALLKKVQPDVIVAVNDLVAVGAYRYLKEQDLRVPEDVALAGFSDLNFMDILEVPLTTVREATSEIGRQASEILLQEIEDPNRPKQQVKLAPELVARKSA